MKRLISKIIIIIGLALIIYFGNVFILFSASNKPLILLFIAEPILFSIIFFGVGFILFVMGVIITFQLKSMQKQASLVNSYK